MTAWSPVKWLFFFLKPFLNLFILQTYPSQYTFCCSVSKSCLTLADPMDCSTPGFCVPHHLPEFAQDTFCSFWQSPAACTSLLSFFSSWLIPSFFMYKILWEHRRETLIKLWENRRRSFMEHFCYKITSELDLKGWVQKVPWEDLPTTACHHISISKPFPRSTPQYSDGSHWNGNRLLYLQANKGQRSRGQ